MDKNQPRFSASGSRPQVSGIPNPTCPVLTEAKEVLEKTGDLHRAIYRLRRSTQRCSMCPEKAECPSIRYFAHEMDKAIRELRREWGLDQE